MSTELNETTKNFLEAWQAWSQQTPPPQKIFYRLYYNEDGHPLFYSMEDLPGLYISIDQELFSRSPRNIRVIKNKIVFLDQLTSKKLIPSEHGTACRPDNVSIITNEQEPHTKWALQ